MNVRICLALCLCVSAAAAHAATCGHAIDKAQALVDSRIDKIARHAPEMRESRAALLHREPTPASLAAAERHRHGDASVQRALAALRRARAADWRGDLKACRKYVAEARADIAPRR